MKFTVDVRERNGTLISMLAISEDSTVHLSSPAKEEKRRENISEIDITFSYPGILVIPIMSVLKHTSSSMLGSSRMIKTFQFIPVDGARSAPNSGALFSASVLGVHIFFAVFKEATLLTGLIGTRSQLIF